MIRRTGSKGGRTPAAMRIAGWAAGALALVLALWGARALAVLVAGICGEPCVVRDVASRVEITTGRVVPKALVSGHFGLTNGVNLAQVDFAGLREKLLAIMPIVRDVRIERRMPDGVLIEIVERVPVARVMSMISKTPGTRVADAEGVVFTGALEEDTRDLPIVRDPNARIVQPGGRLTGMALAGLRLVEKERASFRELGIRDVNTSLPDWLEATLKDGSLAHIAWLDMAAPPPVSPLSSASLARQLKRLSMAVATGCSPGTAVWIATNCSDTGRVFANDPARAL